MRFEITYLFVSLFLIMRLIALLRNDMQEPLVLVVGGSVFTNSDILSRGLNMEHRSVVSLIKNYEYLDEFQSITTKKHRVYKKEVDIYLLTELQATLLISLMKNSKEVIAFKIKLVTEFYKQRRLLERLATQHNNAEWLDRRQETKVMRRECTDVIQEFVVYAKEQGSKSAEKYYMNLSRMELTGLFILEQKYPNARDVMSMRQLNLIEMADEAIAISLKESMHKELPYKDCYQEAKARIELLAKVIPRSPLPAFLEGIGTQSMSEA